MIENSTSAETAENTETSLLTFELNDTLERTAKATFKGKKLDVVHEINRPSLQDLVTRDEKQPYRSQEVGEDLDQVLAEVSGKADVELYNKLIVRTEGYKNNVTPEQTEEERALALKGIPSPHKSSIIKDLVTVTSEVIYDADEDVTEFVWSEGQTYRIRSEIGSNGQFVVYSEIREPSERQLELYGGSTKFYIERPKGSTKKPITRITTDLRTAIALFDEMIQSIVGLTYNGNSVDLNDKKQKSAIDAYLKRSVVTAVMEETKLDMGE